jgi:hypothetical protein
VIAILYHNLYGTTTLKEHKATILMNLYYFKIIKVQFLWKPMRNSTVENKQNTLTNEISLNRMESQMVK